LDWLFGVAGFWQARARQAIRATAGKARGFRFMDGFSFESVALGTAPLASGGGDGARVYRT
jgi:hypothetical protein